MGAQVGRNGEICSHANGSSPSRPSGSARRDPPAQTELVVGTQLMGETTIVTFAGEIDVATMKQFAGTLRMHLNDGAPTVLIDMAEVGFASAGSVMRVLLTAIREARTRGAVVQVLLSPAVRRVAAVLGVVGECEAEAGVSEK
jgi:anti-anti-sigma factor